MDALDILNAQIEGLCETAGREAERILDQLIAAPWPARPVVPEVRAEVAELALDYAEWARLRNQYRSLIRPRAAVMRMK